MITDPNAYFAPGQQEIVFDASHVMINNGTPMSGYISAVCEVRGLDLLIELNIVIVILLVFILYYQVKMTRRCRI